MHRFVSVSHCAAVPSRPLSVPGSDSHRSLLGMGPMSTTSTYSSSRTSYSSEADPRSEANTSRSSTCPTTTKFGKSYEASGVGTQQQRPLGDASSRRCWRLPAARWSGPPEYIWTSTQGFIERLTGSSAADNVGPCATVSTTSRNRAKSPRYVSSSSSPNRPVSDPRFLVLTKWFWTLPDDRLTVRLLIFLSNQVNISSAG